MPDAPELVHGTVVAYGGICALVRGPSGSGKSDLALRCLAVAPTPMLCEPVRLVADDYAHLNRVDATIVVRAPETILGKLEVRGVGIFNVEALREACLSIIIELVQSDKVPRLPDPGLFEDVLGVQIPVMRLCAFESSAAVKVLVALEQVGRAERNS